MPRIEADNIEEHIRIQNDRILNAAGDLFRVRGYHGTDMGEIAKSIGLARNSLYRYYPSKDHILLACVKRGMADNLEKFRQLSDAVQDPRERIEAWLNLQMEVALGPCHATMQMVGEVRETSPELRKEIMGLHEIPNSVLESSVSEITKGSHRNAQLISRMIGSMVQSAAREAIDNGRVQAVTEELKHSVAAVLAK